VTPRIFAPGRRKLLLGLLAFGALCAHAAWTHADFVPFGDRVLLWLSAMLAAHVTQQATAKTPGAP
jgi:hypothetical protein